MEGRREGAEEEEEEREEWRVTVNPIFYESDTNENSSRPASLQRPAYLINQC